MIRPDGSLLWTLSWAQGLHLLPPPKDKVAIVNPALQSRTEAQRANLPKTTQLVCGRTGTGAQIFDTKINVCPSVSRLFRWITQERDEIMWKPLPTWAGNPRTQNTHSPVTPHQVPPYLSKTGWCKWHSFISCPLTPILPSLFSHSRKQKWGKNHFKVIWLFLAYFYCHIGWSTSPLGNKGLLWQGTFAASHRESASPSVPSDVQLDTGRWHLHWLPPLSDCEVCDGIPTPQDPELPAEQKPHIHELLQVEMK